MNKIKYVGFYNKFEYNIPNRDYSLAAAKKMDYIAKVINEIGYEVEIVSPSTIIKKQQKGFHKVKYIKINNNQTLTLGPSFSNYYKITGFIKIFIMWLWLFNYIVKNTNKDDVVILYHNYKLSFPLLLAKKVKKFHLVLQIEEVYQEVWKINCFYRYFENKIILECGNDCLTVSELLEQHLEKKNTAISYGGYLPYKGDINRAVDIGCIKLVYTGNIEKVRKSAFLAVEAMRYLPNNYILNISGSIDKACENEYLQLIEDVNNEKGKEVCKYLGVLPDKEYEKLLLNSDIGLNPQQEGNYSGFLFPSKIITYLSYNLRVVTTRGASIVNSQLADVLFFSDNFLAKSVAEGIQKINLFKVYNSISRIKNLDDIFSRKLRLLLNKKE